MTAVLLLGAGAMAGCSQSYEDTVNGCVAALKDRAEDATGRPAACDGVKDDDYTALTISQHLKDGGWVDENGDVDMEKLLEGSGEAP
ncbi:hypothetical protein [Streptomyces sp. C10-9-1]|uniref:hypothetical protein n=1 Tax=Streptomyces sp. C10-9-1 TaxID=1859285 RepID=UPI003F49E2AE